MASSSKQYHYIGLHADTVYVGDKAIPVGHGMEPISLTDDDLNDERNTHVKDNFQVIEAPPAKLSEKGGEK